MRGWAFLFPALLHALALALYLDWREVLGNAPVADTDFATNWAETWTASHFLDDGHLWGYDPYFMAGYPSGLLYHNSARLVALASWLMNQTGVSLVLSYNLALLVLLAAAPLLVYPAARWLGLDVPGALVAQLATLGLWLADPLIGWSWHGGAFTFLVAIQVALLVLASADRITSPETGGAWLPLAVWYAAGPLVFWLHSFSLLLLLGPLLVLAAIRWRANSSRQRFHLLIWPPLVILVNLPWIIPSIRTAGRRARSDFFLQGGLDALAADLLGIGFIDGASRPGLLGLRWTALTLGGVGLWRLARSHPALWSVAAGAWFGLALAYGAVHLPGGGNLQPYRYIQQAAIWSTLGLLPAIRATIAWSRRGDAPRRAVPAVASVLLAVWIISSAWPARPPALGGPDRFWRGPSDESQGTRSTGTSLRGAGSSSMTGGSRRSSRPAPASRCWEGTSSGSRWTTATRRRQSGSSWRRPTPPTSCVPCAPTSRPTTPAGCSPAAGTSPAGTPWHPGSMTIRKRRRRSDRSSTSTSGASTLGLRRSRSA